MGDFFFCLFFLFSVNLYFIMKKYVIYFSQFFFTKIPSNSYEEQPKLVPNRMNWLFTIQKENGKPATFDLTISPIYLPQERELQTSGPSHDGSMHLSINSMVITSCWVNAIIFCAPLNHHVALRPIWMFWPALRNNELTYKCFTVKANQGISRVRLCSSFRSWN